ncbi:MAG: SDR family oxidoreductase, partial [Gammaproteobacteria bacterium]
MKSFAVVTGGGTGIGRAVALRLSRQENLSVLIIGRTLQSLQETQQLAEKPIAIVQADVSTAEGRDAILNAIPEHAHIAYLIHNAAIMDGSELKNISLESWRHQMAVNVEAPLFLTQKLLPFLKEGRILHISSGFAHMPTHGVGAYCISKAALYMMYKCLALELTNDHIAVGSLRPGPVDTPFQHKMRNFPPDIFPNVTKFIEMKKENTLNSPEKVAKFAEWVLLNTD